MPAHPLQRLSRSVCSLAIGALVLSAQPAAAQLLDLTPTTFTYQGVLNREGVPYTGTADYRFTLFNADGTPFGGPMLVPGVEVVDGLFAVPLDFGGAVHGPGREISIDVRTPAWDGIGSEPTFVAFPQRTSLSATPHALSTRGLTVSDDGTRVAIGGEPGLPQLSVFSGDNDQGLLVQSSNIFGTRLHLSNTSSRGLFWSLVSSGFGASIPGSLTVRRGTDLLSASTVLSITPDLDIGIRTGNPIAALDVNGTMFVRDTVTVSGELEVRALLTTDGVVSNGAITASDTILGRRAIFASGGAPGSGNGMGNGFAFVGNGGDNDSGLFSLGDGQVSLFTNALERVRFDSRNIAIGGAFAPLNNLHILHQNAGTGWGIRIQSEAQSTFQTGMRVSNDGFFDITNHISDHSGFARLTSSGVWTTVSDERTKEDIHHLDNALDRAMRLDPVAYRYKGTDTEEIGFTAQNVAAQFPSLVTSGDDLMTLNYSGLSTVAIAALQELKAEKDAEINELRELVERLNARLETLESSAVQNPHAD
jgi:hypothetical protein